MNRTQQTGFLAACVVGAAFLAGAAVEVQRVPLNEIGDKFVLVGQLADQPIGTFMTVEGVADREWMGEGWPVAIDTVDGKKLAKAITVGVTGTPHLTQGTRYVLRGYEACGMGGTPADPKFPTADMRQQSLGFRSWFAATKVEQPAAMKP